MFNVHVCSEVGHCSEVSVKCGNYLFIVYQCIREIIRTKENKVYLNKVIVENFHDNSTEKSQSVLRPPNTAIGLASCCPTIATKTTVHGFFAARQFAVKKKVSFV